MMQRMKQFTLERPRLKKTVGWIFIVVGFFSLITPLTPGGFLFFIGLELIGVRLLFVEKFLEKRAAQKMKVAE